MTEQANFTYSPLEKVFEKQIKAIENQGCIENNQLNLMQLLKNMIVILKKIEHLKQKNI